MKQVYVKNYLDSEELNHDYNIIKNDKELILMTSNDNEWVKTWRNKEVARLNDTGNGLEIKIEGLKTIILDYSQVIELFTLLSVQNDTKIEIRETNVIKVNNNAKTKL